jgi:hypothetical protein
VASGEIEAVRHDSPDQQVGDEAEKQCHGQRLQCAPCPAHTSPVFAQRLQVRPPASGRPLHPWQVFSRWWHFSQFIRHPSSFDVTLGERGVTLMGTGPSR